MVKSTPVLAQTGAVEVNVVVGIELIVTICMIVSAMPQLAENTMCVTILAPVEV